jgi:hypothetical protein
MLPFVQPFMRFFITVQDFLPTKNNIYCTSKNWGEKDINLEWSDQRATWALGHLCSWALWALGRSGLLGALGSWALWALGPSRLLGPLGS